MNTHLGTVTSELTDMRLRKSMVSAGAVDSLDAVLWLAAKFNMGFTSTFAPSILMSRDVSLLLLLLFVLVLLSVQPIELQGVVCPRMIIIAQRRTCGRNDTERE